MNENTCFKILRQEENFAHSGGIFNLMRQETLWGAGGQIRTRKKILKFLFFSTKDTKKHERETTDCTDNTDYFFDRMYRINGINRIK